MRTAAGDLGRRAIALLVLLAAAWILFKLVLGAVTFVAWIAVAALAVIAVIWALRVL